MRWRKCWRRENDRIRDAIQFCSANSASYRAQFSGPSVLRGLCAQSGPLVKARFRAEAPQRSRNRARTCGGELRASCHRYARRIIPRLLSVLPFFLVVFLPTRRFNRELRGARIHLRPSTNPSSSVAVTSRHYVEILRVRVPSARMRRQRAAVTAGERNLLSEAGLTVAARHALHRFSSVATLFFFPDFFAVRHMTIRIAHGVRLPDMAAARKARQSSSSAARPAWACRRRGLARGRERNWSSSAKMRKAARPLRRNCGARLRC